MSERRDEEWAARDEFEREAPAGTVHWSAPSDADLERLRGYEPVQLATALAAESSLVAAGLPGLTFVAADADLVAAARAERLGADDPNLHP